MTMALSRSSLALALLALCAGCSLAPTKMRENRERKFDGAGALASPIRVTPETVVVDARPQFEFSVVHVPHSVNMRWWDYTESAQPENRGVLLGDLESIARRLATIGLQPSAHVVVVGRGLGGQGEEGRIAWMLGYLGFTNVQFATFESLKFRYTNVVEENVLKSQQPWKPEPVESLMVSRTEVKFAINHNAVHQPASFKGGAPVLYRIIDVRSADDYLGREGLGAARKIPNMEGINIPWQEFFDSSMRPRAEMFAKMTSVGVSPQHRIIVLSGDGVSSGAVTMALRALGFNNAGNYAGGIKDLMSAYRYEGE